MLAREHTVYGTEHKNDKLDCAKLCNNVYIEEIHIHGWFSHFSQLYET